MSTRSIEQTPRALNPPKSPQQKKTEKKATNKTKRGINEEDKETINSLKREQERLIAELNAEKTQSDKTKTLYASDLNYYASTQKNSFTNLKVLLGKLRTNDPNILEALRLIGEYEENDSPFVPDTPRVTELANEAKEAELANDKTKRDNRSLKISYKQVSQELADLKSQVEEAEQKLEALKSSKKEVKDKLHILVDKAKKNEESWKSKVAALQAQLDAQD